MNPYSEIRVYLVVVGFEGDPDKVAQSLGISPDKVSRFGERINQRTNKTWKDNSFEVHSGDDFSSDLETHLESLYQKLYPSIENLIAFYKSKEAVFCQLNIVLEIYNNDRPAVHFDKKWIRLLAALDAGIDVDMYVFSKGEK